MLTDLGKMLKKLMVDADTSQKQLAGELDISPSILSNYMTGKNIPEMELIDKLIGRFQLEGDALKEIFSKNFADTARHNHRISIDTRFFEPERVNLLVKILTVLLLYPELPAEKKGSVSCDEFTAVRNDIAKHFNSLDELKNLKYRRPE